MKNLLLASALFISIGAAAQFSCGYYGLHNMKSDMREGWGFGMDGISSSFTKEFPIKLQAGLGYNVLWAGQKHFQDIVLEDVQAPSDISLNNSMFSINGIFRVSVPSPDGRLVPYAEFSPGIGFNRSTVDIHNEDQECNLITANNKVGFNLGTSAGLLIKLNDIVAVDAGLTWDSNFNRGSMIMMNTVNVSDGLSYGMKAAPSTVVCFRIGVRFYLNKTDCCSYAGCTDREHHTACGHKELPHQ